MLEREPTSDRADIVLDTSSADAYRRAPASGVQRDQMLVLRASPRHSAKVANSELA
jgi:hypothetical protein